MKTSRKSIKVTATACDSKAVTITIVANGVTVKVAADSATITIDDAEVTADTPVAVFAGTDDAAIITNHSSHSWQSWEREGALKGVRGLTLGRGIMNHGCRAFRPSQTLWRLPRRTTFLISRPPPFQVLSEGLVVVCNPFQGC